MQQRFAIALSEADNLMYLTALSEILGFDIVVAICARLTPSFANAAFD